MGWEKTIEDYRKGARQVRLAFLVGSVLLLIYGLMAAGMRIQDFAGFAENPLLLFLYLYTPYLFLATGVAVGGFLVERWLNLEDAKGCVVFILALPFIYSALRFPIEIVLFGFPHYWEFIRCSLLSTVLLIGYAFLLWSRGSDHL